MSAKARVQDGGVSAGHAQVAVFVGSDADGWALAGHLRPRTGDEADALARKLARGMPVEDHRGVEMAWLPTPLERVNTSMRHYLGTVANRLGVVHAHLGNGDMDLDTAARVESVGEDVVGEVEALRTSGELWEQARLLAQAWDAHGTAGAAEALQLAAGRIADIVHKRGDETGDHGG